MQINTNNQLNKKGSALVAAIVLTVTIAVFAAASLRLITHEYRFAKTSAIWSQTIHTAEAGIEVGMEAFRNQALYQNGWSGWSHPSSNVYTLSDKTLNRADGSSSGSRYSVTANTNTPSITATGTQDIPAMNEQMSRTIQVMLEPIIWNPFEHAMLSKGDIKLTGSSYIDSFHSGDPSKSTDGQYDPAKADNNADVGSMSESTNSIDARGNGTLHGDFFTTPDGSALPGGSFLHNGDTSNDLDVDIPNVVVPFDTAQTDAAINGTRTINVAGSQIMSVPSVRLVGNKILTVTGSGTLKLYVEGETYFSGDSQFVLVSNPTNASLKIEIYANGEVLLNNMINTPGNAADLSIKGTTNCSKIHFTGNDDFIGTIYAPQADVDLTGNGDFMGSIVGGKIMNNGTAGFHYDEALASNQVPIIVGYNIISWRELTAE